MFGNHVQKAVDRYNDLIALAHQPGWKLYVEELTRRRDTALREVCRSDDSHEICRQAAMLKVLNELLDWREREVKTAGAQVHK